MPVSCTLDVPSSWCSELFFGSTTSSSKSTASYYSKSASMEEVSYAKAVASSSRTSYGIKYMCYRSQSLSRHSTSVWCMYQWPINTEWGEFMISSRTSFFASIFFPFLELNTSLWKPEHTYGAAPFALVTFAKTPGDWAFRCSKSVCPAWTLLYS